MSDEDYHRGQYRAAGFGDENHVNSHPGVPAFTVTSQAFEFTGNVAGGGLGGAPYGMGQLPTTSQGLPALHPQLPEAIWVLDPLTRKLRVPTHLIVPTAATATLGTTPSLCIAFLENRCRHPWCRQAHIPAQVVQRLRVEAQNAPTCCHDHKSPHDIAFLTSRFEHIEISFPTGTKLSVPASRFAVTVGLQRHLAQVVPKDRLGPSFDVSSRMVCRLHLNHRCRYLEDCNNLHVCREHEPVQTAFAELGPNDRSPLASGAPSQPPSSAHSTPLASGTPHPGSPSVVGGPPKYEGGHGRSPPFAGLQPPSPLVSPANSFSPAPGHSAMGTPAGSFANPYSNAAPNLSSGTAPLAALTTQMPQVFYAHRAYNVVVLRTGAVSDSEFAALAEAQNTLFGNAKVETVDLVSGAPGKNSKPPSPAPQQQLGGLSALPPPASGEHGSFASLRVRGAPKAAMNSSRDTDASWGSQHTTPQRARVAGGGSAWSPSREHPSTGSSPRGDKPGLDLGTTIDA